MAGLSKACPTGIAASMPGIKMCRQPGSWAKSEGQCPVTRCMATRYSILDSRHKMTKLQCLYNIYNDQSI